MVAAKIRLSHLDRCRTAMADFRAMAIAGSMSVDPSVPAIRRDVVMSPAIS